MIDYHPEEMTFNGRVFFGRNRIYGLGFSRTTQDIAIDISGEITNIEFLVNLNKTSRLSFTYSQDDREEDDPFEIDASKTTFGVSYEIVNKLRRQKYIYIGFTGAMAETDETDKFLTTTDTVSVTST